MDQNRNPENHIINPAENDEAQLNIGNVEEEMRMEEEEMNMEIRQDEEGEDEYLVEEIDTTSTSSIHSLEASGAEATIGSRYEHDLLESDCDDEEEEEQNGESDGNDEEEEQNGKSDGNVEAKDQNGESDEEKKASSSKKSAEVEPTDNRTAPDQLVNGMADHEEVPGTSALPKDEEQTMNMQKSMTDNDAELGSKMILLRKKFSQLRSAERLLNQELDELNTFRSASIEKHCDGGEQFRRFCRDMIGSQDITTRLLKRLADRRSLLKRGSNGPSQIPRATPVRPLPPLPRPIKIENTLIDVKPEPLEVLDLEDSNKTHSSATLSLEQVRTRLDAARNEILKKDNSSELTVENLDHMNRLREMCFVNLKVNAAKETFRTFRDQVAPHFRVTGSDLCTLLGKRRWKVKNASNTTTDEQPSVSKKAKSALEILDIARQKFLVDEIPKKLVPQDMDEINNIRDICLRSGQKIEFYSFRNEVAARLGRSKDSFRLALVQRRKRKTSSNGEAPRMSSSSKQQASTATRKNRSRAVSGHHCFSTDIHEAFASILSKYLSRQQSYLFLAAEYDELNSLREMAKKEGMLTKFDELCGQIAAHSGRELSSFKRGLANRRYGKKLKGSVQSLEEDGVSSVGSGTASIPEVKPFKCPHCPLEFMSASGRKKHMKKYHPDPDLSVTANEQESSSTFTSQSSACASDKRPVRTSGLKKRGYYSDEHYSAFQVISHVEKSPFKLGTKKDRSKADVTSTINVARKKLLSSDRDPSQWLPKSELDELASLQAMCVAYRRSSDFRRLCVDIDVFYRKSEGFCEKAISGRNENSCESLPKSRNRNRGSETPERTLPEDPVEALEFARAKYLHPNRSITLTTLEKDELNRVREKCLGHSIKLTNEFIELCREISDFSGRAAGHVDAELGERRTKTGKREGEFMSYRENMVSRSLTVMEIEQCPAITLEQSRHSADSEPPSKRAREDEESVASNPSQKMKISTTNTPCSSVSPASPCSLGAIKNEISMQSPEMSNSVFNTSAENVKMMLSELKALQPSWSMEEMECAARWLNLLNEDDQVGTNNLAAVFATLATCASTEEVRKQHADLFREAATRVMTKRLAASQSDARSTSSGHSNR